MNKLKGSLAAKVIAIILLAASCLALCGAVAGVVGLDGYGAYQAASTQEVLSHHIDERLENAVHSLLEEAQYTPVDELYRGEPMRFELLDENGDLIYGTLGEDETVERSRTVGVKGFYGGMYFTDENEPLTVSSRNGFGGVVPETTPSPAQETAQAAPEGTPVCFVRMSWTDQSGDQNAEMEMRALAQLFPWRYALIGVAVVSFLLAVLFFVFLMAAAGHRDASGEVKAGIVEKIPFDLLLVFTMLAIWGLGTALGAFLSGNYMVGGLLVLALCLLVGGLLLLLCLMTLAVRLKLGTFLSSCLIWRLLRWSWKCVKAVFHAFGRLLKGLPLVWKWIPLFAVLMIIDFVLTAQFRRDTDMLIFVKLLQWALLGAALLYLALCFRRLRLGAKAIAAGDETVVIDEKYMLGDIKDHAEDLNHIRDGLSRAVDERMKSERLRTELITNVSHDIKTPLTSIVNYVDLLSREEPENEKAQAYLEVLQRQSARLKKLTDDLVEASKASTGNLPVAKERLELGVLLDQTAGEYGERLAEKNLDLRVTKPEEPLYVQADPRHLWRMLDNLMNNILKYAQPGTRVYLDLAREGGRAALSFRNISAAPLNVKPEELTERFVRGDASRSTEGSGLGLAIAASLARLQNIDMDLSIDGDLFKVVLRF